MKSQRRTIDHATILYETESHKDRIEHLRQSLSRVTSDSEKRSRHDKAMCPVCFYAKGLVAGQAFTSRQCAFCDEMITHHNTACPIACVKCAKEAGICRQCGADVDLKNRRSRPLPKCSPTIKSEEE